MFRFAVAFNLEIGNEGTKTFNILIRVICINLIFVIRLSDLNMGSV